jgi:hypothetical protein
VVGSSLFVAALVALSAWEGGRSRDSRGAHWSVALCIAAAFVVAGLVGRRRQLRTTRAWFVQSSRWIWHWRTQPRAQVVAVIVWSSVILALVGWDAASFVVQSHAFPTLSYFMGRVTRYPVGRGLVFFLWLGLGGYLVAGWRAGGSKS